MKSIAFAVTLLLGTFAALTARSEPINRLILFKLDLPKGSPEEKAFLERTETLATIPALQALVWLNIPAGHKEFTHGLRLVFADQPSIKRYTQDPVHKKYIKEVWVPQAKATQITDYTETTVTPRR